MRSIVDHYSWLGTRVPGVVAVPPVALATVTARPSPPYTVGFAAETEQLVKHARAKLERKNVDLMVANLVGGENNPFGSDRNALVLIDRQGETDLGRDSKTRLAAQLIDQIAKRYHAEDSATRP